MFADDTFCLNADEDIKTLIQNVNVQVNRMAVWFRANKLAVNINKTKYIIFTIKRKKIDENTPPLLYNENEPNEPVDASLITPLERYHDNHLLKEGKAYKLLGIYLDELLSLNFHTEHLVSKLTRSLYLLSKPTFFIHI
jgi:hypothetical protein